MVPISVLLSSCAALVAALEHHLQAIRSIRLPVSILFRLHPVQWYLPSPPSHYLTPRSLILVGHWAPSLGH